MAATNFSGRWASLRIDDVIFGDEGDLDPCPRSDAFGSRGGADPTACLIVKTVSESTHLVSATFRITDISVALNALEAKRYRAEV